MKDLDRQAFLEFMSERGVDVEFDSDAPGFFNGEGKLIATIDEIFSGPPFLQTFFDEELETYTHSPIKELETNVELDERSSIAEDAELILYLSYQLDSRQSKVDPPIVYESINTSETPDGLNVRSAA